MRTFADLDALRAAAGEHLGHSEWLRIEQRRLDAFARATGSDRPEFLALSLIAALIDQVMVVRGVSHSVNYGCNRVRFGAPLTAGSRLRAGAELTSVEDAPGGVHVVTTWTLTVDGATQPACIAETVSRYCE